MNIYTRLHHFKIVVWFRIQNYHSLTHILFLWHIYTDIHIKYKYENYLCLRASQL